MKITKNALDIFSKYIQDNCFKREAGGILLGRMIVDTEDIVIDLVTEPQKNDIRKRRFFRRNNEHQQIIDREWHKSKGTCNYLGEWHTHPEKVPIPSSVDLENWIKQLHVANYEGSGLFFIIVGIKETEVPS